MKKRKALDKIKAKFKTKVKIQFKKLRCKRYNEHTQISYETI